MNWFQDELFQDELWKENSLKMLGSTSDEETQETSCIGAENSDSDASNPSIEQPASIVNRDGLDDNSPRNIINQLDTNMQLFITLFESSVSDLQEQINTLLKITDDVEDLHRTTTIGSLSGGVIGAAGGITAAVGIALMPFTLGASLIVTGVGVGVGFFGGVTGAASNITRMIHQKVNRGKIEEIIKQFTDKTNCLIEVLKDIQENIEEIKALDAQFPVAEFSQAGIIGAKSLTGIAELVRLGLVASIGRVVAHVSKTVRVAGSITGVLIGLSLALDIVFIIKDAKKIHEINKKRRSGGRNQQQKQIRSDTLKFINAMRETAQIFQDTLDELKQAKEVIENELNQ